MKSHASLLSALLMAAVSLGASQSANATGPVSGLPAGAKACFFVDANYKGASFCSDGNSAWVGNAFNDKITSLRVAPGYNIQLFKDSNFNGPAASLESDFNNLKELGFDNTISSFKVFQNGVPAQ